MPDQKLEDAYIVMDCSPRFQSLLLVTFNKEEALKLCSTCEDFVVMQQSGKEFQTSFRN